MIYFIARAEPSDFLNGVPDRSYASCIAFRVSVAEIVQHCYIYNDIVRNIQKVNALGCPESVFLS